MSATKRNFWIVTSAWPTINNVPHLGTILQLLSADVISRYLRLVSEQVISVSGSDVYGTPVLISAEAEKLTPEEYSRKLHGIVLDLLDKWNIKLDNYTITTTDYHKNFIQQYYQNLLEHKTIFLRENEQFYCEHCQFFLPDRFVEGICPYCNHEKARGDQCPNEICNAILTPELLIEPICSRCHSSPITRQTQHFYLDLAQFEKSLKSFITASDKFSPLVVNEALKFFQEGLQPRAITRDLSWGIDASFLFPNHEQKVFYVWAEDVLGYLSASAEFIEKNYPELNWKDIWKNNSTKTVFCLGLDNIFFHSIWLSGLLLASKEDFVLPHYLSTSQFLQFDGMAFSKSKNIGLWIDEALELAPADLWRFYLIYYRPEKKSQNFDWDSFVELINEVLISNVINLIYRVCSLIWRYSDGKVIIIGKYEQDSTKEFISEINFIINKIISTILVIDCKTSLHDTIQFSKQINTFLSKQEPWKNINKVYRLEDIIISYEACIILVSLLQPVIPSISTQLKKQLKSDDIIFFNHSYNLHDLTKNNLKSVQLPKLKKILQPLDKETLLKKYTLIKHNRK